MKRTVFSDASSTTFLAGDLFLPAHVASSQARADPKIARNRETTSVSVHEEMEDALRKKTSSEAVFSEC